jgi:hypothetical protein
LLLPVARLEDFELAAQNRRQPQITLARFVYQFAAPHDAARAERLQHGELSVIELRKGNALRIAVELLVFVEFGHKRIHQRAMVNTCPVLFRKNILANGGA